MRISVLFLSLTAFLSFGFAAQAQTETVSSGKQLAQVTTINGRTYLNVSILDVEPDGLVVSYKPSQPGIAMATLKFAELPASLQTQYGYDPAKAAAFEKQQDQATAQWRQQQSAQEAAIQRYRAMAELNRSLGGEQLGSYSVSLDDHGNVAAHGFTGNVLPYAWYCPRGWRQHGGKVQSPTLDGSRTKMQSAANSGY